MGEKEEWQGLLVACGGGILLFSLIGLILWHFGLMGGHNDTDESLSYLCELRMDEGIYELYCEYEGSSASFYKLVDGSSNGWEYNYNFEGGTQEKVVSAAYNIFNVRGVSYHIVDKTANESSGYECMTYISYCFCPYYSIVYVDEFNTNACYAFRYSSVGSYEGEYISESLAAPTCYDWAASDRRICGTIKTRGEVWCLRNKTRCLKLEADDKICHIIELV